MSGVLIAANWSLYVWAVNSGHVVEASLGYFINPLVSVVFGVFLLKERLRRALGILLQKGAGATSAALAQA